MEVLGRVTERISEDSVRVEILRTSACGGKCGECSTSCGSKSYIIAKNFDNAVKDDIVKIESDDKKVLILSFLVFIIPLLVIVKKRPYKRPHIRMQIIQFIAHSVVTILRITLPFYHYRIS